MFDVRCEAIPRDAAIVLLATHPRIISACFPARSSLVPPRHTQEAKLTYRFLEQFTGRSPEASPIQDWWDRLGTTQIYVSRGIGTIVLPWRLRCPAEIIPPQLLPGTSESFPSSSADGWGSILCWNAPAGRGMSPAGN